MYRNKVLNTTKWVVNNSKHVKINLNKLYKYCSEMVYPEFINWLQLAPIDLFSLPFEERLNFIAVLNSISFCYWPEPKWTVQFNDNIYDGTWALVISLFNANNDRYQITNFKYLSTISESDFENIFNIYNNIPLGEERLKILREFGRSITANFDGKISNLILSANQDTLTLLDLLLKFIPGFTDESKYKGNKIFFYKRAQLLISDIHGLFSTLDYRYKFINLCDLTACADYKLPLVLNKHGILEYSQQLNKKIKLKIPLEKDSIEEVEIRANTIWAIEEIKNSLNKIGINVTSSQLNDYFWLISQNKEIYDIPYHRVKTICY